MIYIFGFEEICLATADVFFTDPNPEPGQEGAEAGVRVELRRLERLPLRASIYSAQPMSLEESLFRVDLFESFPSGRGARDRVHYHPHFEGWDPSLRVFDRELSADPLGWLGRKLSDLPSILGMSDHRDSAALAEKSEEIVATIDTLWAKVRSGLLDPPPGWTEEPAYRLGWL